eukprot:jgi/Mesen1/6294/ME000325S05433
MLLSSRARPCGWSPPSRWRQPCGPSPTPCKPSSWTRLPLIRPVEFCALRCPSLCRWTLSSGCERSPQTVPPCPPPCTSPPAPPEAASLA